MKTAEQLRAIVMADYYRSVPRQILVSPKTFAAMKRELGRHDDAWDEDVGGDLLEVEPIPEGVPVCSLPGIQGVRRGVVSSKFDAPPRARAGKRR